MNTKLNRNKNDTEGTTSIDDTAPTDKQQFLKETREFWEKRTGQPVTDEDAREIIANITGFFKVIAKWDSRAKEKKKGW